MSIVPTETTGQMNYLNHAKHAGEGKCQRCGKRSAYFDWSNRLADRGCSSTQLGCNCEPPPAPSLDDTSESTDCSPIPWHASHTIPGTPPKNMLWTRDNELMEAALLGNCDRLQACIARGALLSVVRDIKGGCALHLAVFSGSIEAVKMLLDAGAYINVSDWRGGTPLYYACEHPGRDNIYVDNPSRRAAIVDLLVQAGSDTAQTCIAGKTAWEAAGQRGYIEIANTVKTSSRRQEFVTLHKQVISKHAPEECEGLVDLMWRSMTANWLIRYDRPSSMRRFRPHPEITTSAVSPADVEEIFKDCQARHNRWWKNTSNDEYYVR